MPSCVVTKSPYFVTPHEHTCITLYVLNQCAYATNVFMQHPYTGSHDECESSSASIAQKSPDNDHQIIETGGFEP